MHGWRSNKLHIKGCDKLGRKVALGGILAAINIIFLYLASYMPSMKLSMYFLAGLMPGLILVEMGARQAWLLYSAVSLMSLLILGNPINIVPYIFIFGLFPLVKYYIEKTRRIYIEIVLKLLFFDIAFLSIYYIWTRLFLVGVILPIPIIWLILGLQIVSVLYDYIFTRMIFYYCDRIRIFWRKD